MASWTNTFNEALFQEILLLRRCLIKHLFMTWSTVYIRNAEETVVCFAAHWDSLLKFQAKNYQPFPCIPIFNNFQKILTIKSIIGINTQALTLNKNPIFTFLTIKSIIGINTYTLTIKKSHRSKYTCINTK